MHAQRRFLHNQPFSSLPPSLPLKNPPSVHSGHDSSFLLHKIERGRAQGSFSFPLPRSNKWASSSSFLAALIERQSPFILKGGERGQCTKITPGKRRQKFLNLLVERRAWVEGSKRRRREITSTFQIRFSFRLR